jgi:hypothetical protein
MKIRKPFVALAVAVVVLSSTVASAQLLCRHCITCPSDQPICSGK